MRFCSVLTLEQIKALYAVEEEIRDRKLVGDDKQLHRLMHSKPLVELFFEWVDRQLQRQGFTPTIPFIQALNYVRARRAGLEVFLTNPPVCPSTRTTWSGRCESYRWVANRGSFAGQSSAPNTSELSRV
jgi:hypothetical protein